MAAVGHAHLDCTYATSEAEALLLLHQGYLPGGGNSLDGTGWWVSPALDLAQRRLGVFTLWTGLSVGMPPNTRPMSEYLELYGVRASRSLAATRETSTLGHRSRVQVDFEAATARVGAWWSCVAVLASAQPGAARDVELLALGTLLLATGQVVLSRWEDS